MTSMKVVMLTGMAGDDIVVDPEEVLECSTTHGKRFIDEQMARAYDEAADKHRRVKRYFPNVVSNSGDNDDVATEAAVTSKEPTKKPTAKK